MNSPDSVISGSQSSPIKLKHIKAHRSIPTASLQTLIKPLRTRLVQPGKPLPAGSQKLEVPNSIQSDHEVKEYCIENVWIYDISLKHAAGESAPTNTRRDSKHHRLLYFAGGSFQSPPSNNHWKFLSKLVKELHPTYVITVVSYPLAPNSPAPSSLPVLETLLRTILQQAAQDSVPITLAGDSSGGNIAISLALKAVPSINHHLEGAQSQTLSSMGEGGTPLRNVLLISPVLDMRCTNPQISEADKHDPVLSASYIEDVAKTWSANLPRDDPAVSPLLADLTPLKRAGVKVHGVLGTFDVLAPDADLFRERLESVGVEGEWLVWEKQMHCFPLAWHYGLEESVRGVEWVVDVLKRNA
ncbi:hypothetical protein EPUS_02478 [Endocarpon pusillum Z07020]|uniref:Alpha/beta hydrolase fold-3 domain-containing protein n=1 Tax=Endocarpon pusillum (strain Z07020 / HMAS-L-300199) TaxID=1263415 RepID=U1G086_ENDPU|nr:uncharacterized protein EPUS_02478 [Endocarpon pusillum Z07020]ERF70612.1 hypothetical protein EPUS_02478 [Endocarpon pusillum Z07020]